MLHFFHQSLFCFLNLWVLQCTLSSAFVPPLSFDGRAVRSVGTGNSICSRAQTVSPLFAKPKGELLKTSTLDRLEPSIDTGEKATFYEEVEDVNNNSGSDLKLNSGSMPDYIPIMTLLWFIALLSSLDRVAMSVAILPISQEYHLTDSIKGQIASLFSVGYGIGIIPAGLFAAVASPRTLMACGVSLWSLATLLTPFAASYITSQPLSMNDSILVTTVIVASSTFPLLFIRAIMGSAESVVLPTTQKLLSNWIPSDKKSGAIAAVYSGFQMGTVGAYLISPSVMDWTGGWRGLFEAYGIVGLGVLIPWLAFARDEPNPESIELLKGYDETKSDSKDIWREGVDIWKSAPWREFLRSPAVWAMTIAHAANNWGLYNTLSWNPTFYSEQYHLDVKDSALLSILPSIAGAAGGLFAGWTSDRILEYLTVQASNEERRTAQVTLLRKVFQSVALLGPGACLLALSSDIPDQPQLAQALLTGTVGLQAFNSAGYGSATQEKAGMRWSGLLYSVTSLPGVIFGSFGVFITGKILETTDQNWSEVFALNAGVDAMGALAFLVLYDSKREFD